MFIRIIVEIAVVIANADTDADVVVVVVVVAEAVVAHLTLQYVPSGLDSPH